MYNVISMRQSIKVPANPLLGQQTKIAIVRSAYYDDLVTAMEEEATHQLQSSGMLEKNIQIITVPGAFEIPLACQKVAPDVDGIIALGIIVQGETHHAEEIARGCTDGLMRVQIEEQTPIAHEVLFVDSLEQAKERCSGEGNKGKEAAGTLLEMIALIQK